MTMKRSSKAILNNIKSLHTNYTDAPKDTTPKNETAICDLCKKPIAAGKEIPWHAYTVCSKKCERTIAKVLGVEKQ